MFTKIREKYIDNLKANFEEYENSLGTKHFHLRSDNEENCFVLAFPTLPKTDDGRAHILEHLVLCGSEKYPSGDPFFAMTRRSLATFMNAMTYPDKTAYPFATTDKKDYFNLLSVYLDATFFPKLDYLNFLQEGWRYEFNDKDELEIQGIVYNEMKGALANKFSLVYKDIQKDLKPNTIYANESGGDPEYIPDLTYQELVDFHKTHYHPSRATIMTFGNIDPVEIQDFYEKEVTSKINTRHDRLFPGKSNLKRGKYQASHSIPCSSSQEESEHMVVLSWLLDESETDTTNDYEIFSNILLNEGGKIHSKLENLGFGRPSQMMGVASGSLEATLHIGLEGLRKEEVKKAEAVIFHELREIANKGVSQKLVDSTLDNVELTIRKISSRGLPFGLSLLLNSLSLATNGRDPLISLDSEQALNSARERFAQKDYVKKLAQNLIENKFPMVSSYFEPKEDFFNQTKEKEKAKINKINQELTAVQKEEIKANVKKLVELQSREKNNDIFPSISPSEVNLNVKPSMPISIKEVQGKPTIGYLDIATNGISYVNVLFDLHKVNKKDWQWVEFIANNLMSMPSKTKNWMKAMEQRNLLSQHTDVSLDVMSDISSSSKGKIFFQITGYQLERKNDNLEKLFNLLINDISFSDIERVNVLIANEIAEFSENLPNVGHYLASAELKSSLSFQGAFEKEVSGVSYVKFLKEVQAMLSNEDGVSEFINKVNKIFEKIKSSPMVIFGVGGKKTELLLSKIQNKWNFNGVKNAQIKNNIYEQTEKEFMKKALGADSNVNYCYSAYSTLNFKNTDSVYLDLAAQLMTNNRLHTELREKGGAYGAGASHNSLSGLFILSTYRDPSFEKTYKEFNNVLDWFIKYNFSEDNLKEAKIGLLKNFDKPSVPRAEAEKHINFHMMEISDQLRQERKQKIISASMDDVKKAVQTYLTNNKSSSCAFISNSIKKEAKKIDFDYVEIKELI